MPPSAYDRLSHLYDLFAGGFEGPLMRRGIESLAPKRGESILEIGCGTGSGVVYIARRVGASGQVTGRR